MAEKAPGWVVPVMRAGYISRGVVYVIVGGLALLAAIRGGSAEGTSGAMSQIRGAPWGAALLWLIAVGLLAYAVWRLMAAALDLENHGHDGKGVIARAGLVITGLIHVGLAFGVARQAMGSGGGGQAPESLTSKLLALPWGQSVVMAVGVIIVGAGVYYGYKGLAEKYKENIRCTPTSERLDPAIKAGLVAHGIVIGLIGIFLFYAGQTTDPGQAGGVGQAFDAVRSQPFGRVLLGLLALGTMSFAIYCWVEAAYRIVPRVAGDDVTTLAAQARARASREARAGLAKAERKLS